MLAETTLGYSLRDALSAMARHYDEVAEDLESGAEAVRHPELLPEEALPASRDGAEYAAARLKSNRKARAMTEKSLPKDVANHHRRQAAHLRELAATATTASLKARLLSEAEEHDRLAAGESRGRTRSRRPGVRPSDLKADARGRL